MRLITRNARLSDVGRIKQLFDVNISMDFYSEEDLERMTGGGDDVLRVTADEDRGGLAVSCFYAFLSTLDEALRVLHVKEKPEALRKYPGDTRTGVFKTTATDPDYRNRGLFSACLSDLQPVLRERGAKLIVAAALRPFGRPIPTMNALRRTGFVPAAELRSPWAETKGYCPYCGKEYCVCDAELFIREFYEKEGAESGQQEG